jgi:hypothetical protein
LQAALEELPDALFHREIFHKIPYFEQCAQLPIMGLLAI